MKKPKEYFKYTIIFIAFFCVLLCLKNDRTMAYASDGNLIYSNTYGWVYVKDGNVDRTYTGLALNEYGWWYVTNGLLDLNYTGMASNEYGWWYVTNGALDWDYTGMASNEYGWWYMTNGMLDWNYTGMASNEYGWWYMTNGMLDWNYTGMASNEYGWWYMTNGALDWNYTGMASNEYGWWYFENGIINVNYTGLAHNEYGTWYYKDGNIAFNYTGKIDANKTSYNVNGGWINPNLDIPLLKGKTMDVEDCKVTSYTGEVTADKVQVIYEYTAQETGWHSISYKTGSSDLNIKFYCYGEKDDKYKKLFEDDTIYLEDGETYKIYVRRESTRADVPGNFEFSITSPKK